MSIEMWSEQIRDIAKMARRAVEAEAPEARVENTFLAMKALLTLPSLGQQLQEDTLKIIREELEEGLKTHK